MTAIPSKASFTGASVTEGGFKTALEQLHDYCTGLFGSDGAAATALATLGAFTDRVGSTVWWPGHTIPSSAFECDGSAKSRSTYATLFGKLVKSATVTMTIASPCVVTWTAHGLANNMPVKFTTTGALPTGLTVGRTYWIVNKATDNFQVALVPGGVAINTSGSQSGTHTAIHAPAGDGDGSTTFNVPNLIGKVPVGAGAGSVATSFNPADVTTGTDTITIQDNTGAWITGMAVVFTTTGTEPTGLTAGNTYYVIRTGTGSIKLASSLANAQNGTAIDITGQGTGVHTITHSRTTRGVGDEWGEDTHAMSLSELLSHSHTGALLQNFVSGTPGWPATGSNSQLDTMTVNATGGNSAMNNSQPSLGGRWIIYHA